MDQITKDSGIVKVNIVKTTRLYVAWKSGSRIPITHKDLFTSGCSILQTVPIAISYFTLIVLLITCNTISVFTKNNNEISLDISPRTLPKYYSSGQRCDLYIFRALEGVVLHWNSPRHC